MAKWRMGVEVHALPCDKRVSCCGGVVFCFFFNRSGPMCGILEMHRDISP